MMLRAFLVLLLVHIQDGLEKIVDTTLTQEEREAAVKSLAKTRKGAEALLELSDQGKLPDELKATASFALSAHADAGIRKEAEKKLPVPKAKDGKPILPIPQLVEMKGDAKAGAAVFRDTKGPNCISCHQLGEEGRMVGPPLTTVATKLSREQLFESILTPSAGILMSYESWIVQTKDGEIKTGIKVEDTDDHITLKDTNGEFIDIPVGKIEQKKQSRLSMMPENLIGTLTIQDLVDLVEFLSRQK